MTRYAQFVSSLTLISLLAACGPAPTADSKGGAAAGADVAYFSNFKLAVGDGSPIQEDLVMVSENGKIKAIGKKSEVKPPQGAARADLNGEVIMPVFINLNARPGLANGPTFGPENFKEESVTNDLKRYLYYGTGSVFSGTDKDGISEKVRDDVKQGKVKAAFLYTAGQGIVQKGGAGALKGMLTEVGSEADARGAVDENAGKKVDFINIAVDEGGVKMKPEIYKAIIDETHKKNLKAVADPTTLADAKDLVKAGVDGLIQSITDREVDDDFVQSMKAKNAFLTPALTALEAKFVYANDPKWLGEQSMREGYPAALSAFLSDSVFVGKMKRDPSGPKYREEFSTAQKNLKKLSAAGVKIGLGSASGSPDTFPGYFEHRELELMVNAGMSIDDVYKAATSVAASLMGLTDSGTLAVGKRADFLVFSSNPFEKIANSKEIDTMYIGGTNVERIPLIQGIQVIVPKVTQEQRNEEKQAEVKDAQDKIEAKMDHYGKFPLGQSEMMKGFAIPTPLHSTHSQKGNVITVNAKPPASGAELKDFYSKALTQRYGWQAAGNCWEKTSVVSKKVNSLCIQASENQAILTLTEK